MALLKQSQASLLFGHSSGGVLGLEVALTYPLKKLALYEPAVTMDGSVPSTWLTIHGAERAVMLEALPTVPLNVKEVKRLDGHVEKYQHVTVDTLLMTGRRGPDICERQREGSLRSCPMHNCLTRQSSSTMLPTIRRRSK